LAIDVRPRLNEEQGAKERRSPLERGVTAGGASAGRRRARLPPLKRTLLFSIGILYIGIIVLAALALFWALAGEDTTRSGLLFAVALLGVGVVFLYAIGGGLLRRTLLEPMEHLVRDAQRIADGDYRHRIGSADTLEFQALSDAVNEMAARLIKDQGALAENIRSLEETNRELIEASDEVVRSARLASVGTLASGIAHEIGNPLSAIIGFVDLARHRLERGSADPEILDSIKEEARRIDGIVRSLLDYARPREERTRPVDTVEVVARVRTLLENQGRFDRVQASWVLPESAPPVAMNPQELEQVLVNLLLNAVDALDGQQDGSVEIRVRVLDGAEVRAPARREGDPPGVNYSHRRRISWNAGGLRVNSLQTAHRIVEVSVTDNGPGIKPDDLERLFDPFFTTKEPGKGTGLGLAVCVRLVEAMGGKIEGINVPGGGAAFIVRLPALPSEEVEDGPAH
jgi:two-component system NtrC family sensor kinase